MTAVGIDGWKAGWIAVVLSDGDIRVEFSDSLRGFTRTYPDTTLVVDVPIGYPLDGHRQADDEARAFVGPRRNSVFRVAPEDVLRKRTYQSALRHCRARYGFGITAQAFALRKKIFEAQALVEKGLLLIEGHPEVSFAALKGNHLEFAKKTWNGQNERRRLLEHAGIAIPDVLDADLGNAPADDILDAAVLAWTASRFASGKAQPLPSPPEQIGGREVAIWY